MSTTSLDMILGELDKSESVTDNQVIGSMLNKVDLSVKTEIPLPPSAINAASLKLLSDYIELLFGKKASTLTRKHMTYSEEYAISHDRGSRKEVVEIFRRSHHQDQAIQRQKSDLLGQIYNR